MAVDVLILNSVALDLRSQDFAFADRLVEPGGLAKCSTAAMPPYTQKQLKAYVDRGCATAGGPGNTAPLLARAGLHVAVGANLGRGPFGGFDIQGRTFYDRLASAGVDLSAIVTHPHLPTGTTFIHVSEKAERGGIVHFPNANDDFDFEVFKPHIRRLSPSVVYYMYSGLSERGDAHGGRDLAAFAAWCRSQGSVVIVDSHTLTGNPQTVIATGDAVSSYKLLEPLLSELDIFFTSFDEAQMILNTLDTRAGGLEAGSEEKCRRFLEFVAARFRGNGRRRVQLFGVTVKNGVYVRMTGPNDSARATLFYPSRYRVGHVVDLVGAGDSFRAGLVAYVARHKSAFDAGTLNLEEAAQMGNLMATLYVTASLRNRYENIPSFAAMLNVVRSGQQFEAYEELLSTLACV